MATVTVLKFPTAEGAEEALAIVQRLQKDHLNQEQELREAFSRT
jgi:uncharacterized membrane protein